MQRSFLPAVVSAQYRGGYRIHLVFNDNSRATRDFRRWFKGPVFEPLKDLDYFRRFFVDGGTVSWPNGADIAPETLYAGGRRQSSKAPAARKRGSRSTS